MNRLQKYLLVLLCLFPRPSLSSGQEMPVSVELQLALFSKVLLFERNLNVRQGNENGLVIGIVYQGANSQATAIQDRVRQILDSLTQFGNRPFRYVLIDLDRTSGFTDVLIRENVNVLYIVPGSDINIDLITTASHIRQMLTFTGVPEYVEDGISIGLEQVGSKPRLIFNMKSLEAEGINLSAKILKLARLIR